MRMISEWVRRLKRDVALSPLGVVAGKPTREPCIRLRSERLYRRSLQRPAVAFPLGVTRSKLQRSQQRPSLIGCALLPKPTIAPPQIEQACTDFIVRAPWCAHGQA